MTETSTQAAPAPLQVRVKTHLPRTLRNLVEMQIDEDIDYIRAGDTLMLAAADRIEELEAALDLSTPTQIAALEAENVKLRAERDEARSEGYAEGRKYSDASIARLGMILDHANAQVSRQAIEIARLTEALKAEQATRGKHLAIKDDGDEIMIANGRVFVSVDADEMSYALLRDGEWKPGQHSLSSSPFEAWREITLAALKGSTDAQA